MSKEDAIDHYFNILINDFILAKDSGLISVRISYKNENTTNKMSYINLMNIIYSDTNTSLKNSDVFMKSLKDRLRDRKLSLDDVCLIHFNIQ